MSILAWIVLGLAAGLIAQFLLAGYGPGGRTDLGDLVIAMVVGVVGALLGGFLASALFGVQPLQDFFDLSTWVTAVVGAVILLILYHLAVGRRATRRGLFR
jgi:uncharacterized membrane protein YeaQ/YmgE (transglycosylase-associated protein family)